eukprot:362057-Chlamydomonas_euryale.AAC.12
MLEAPTGLVRGALCNDWGLAAEDVEVIEKASVTVTITVRVCVLACVHVCVRASLPPPAATLPTPRPSLSHSAAVARQRDRLEAAA